MTCNPGLSYYEENFSPGEEFIMYIEREMDDYKMDAINRFKIIHPNFAEEIASTIAFGYDNDLPEASKIVHYLFLNEKHIASLNNDLEKMRELIFKERLDIEENESKY